MVSAMPRNIIRRFDEFQRRSRLLSFPFAVVKHYGEDGAGGLAASMAYFGIFSLFPLLLVFVSVVGLVVRHDVELQQRLLDSAIAQFPVIGNEIRQNLGAIDGTGLSLGIGIALSLWAGIGGVRATQSAFDTVWGVAIRDRPNALSSIVRSLGLLLTIGVTLLATALLAGFAGGSGSGTPFMLLGSALLNVLAIAAAYRVLTAANLTWGDVAWGAAFAGIGWTILLAVGGWIVGRRVASSSDVYGGFAVVIGLLAWIYLGAQLVLIGLEVNVVRVARLWPRSLSQHITERDARTLRRLARREERHRDEIVDVRFARDVDDQDDHALDEPRR
jgi:YihY family inner membrane protein